MKHTWAMQESEENKAGCSGQAYQILVIVATGVTLLINGLATTLSLNSGKATVLRDLVERYSEDMARSVANFCNLPYIF